MGFLEYYLIAINVIGFILFAINTWLYTYTPEGQIDKFLTITSILGGSLGIIIAILIIDRKALKGNMMSRVFVACVFVIQLVLFLVLKGVHGERLTLAFWDFFHKYRLFLFYLIVINIITFIVFALDKRAAVKKRSRTRNIVLLGLCFIGGSLGGLAAMYLFKHKTNKKKHVFPWRWILFQIKGHDWLKENTIEFQKTLKCHNSYFQAPVTIAFTP